MMLFPLLLILMMRQTFKGVINATYWSKARLDLKNEFGGRI